jgi:predicted secreted Zn-dependent protease
MKEILLTFVAVAGLSLPAAAAGLSKTYSYFSVGGRTPEEIESDLNRKGPRVGSTGGWRHPSATQTELTPRITYTRENRGCVISKASVNVQTKIILPRWRSRASADSGTELYWDTLSVDIQRHEETHVMIARNHARDLELALRNIGWQRDCKVAAAKAKAVSKRIFARHDRAQREFDRVEGMTFESRMTRLLRYKMDR